MMTKLIWEGVIERAHSEAVYSYISPAHWVSNDEGKIQFWLVTDLRRLNEAVESEAFTFPTPSKVMTQVDPASQVFIVSDLALG